MKSQSSPFLTSNFQDTSWLGLLGRASWHWTLVWRGLKRAEAWPAQGWTQFFWIHNFFVLFTAKFKPEKEEYGKNKNHNKRTLGSFILTSRNLLSVAKIFVFVRTRFYDASSEMRKSGNAENFPPRIWILEKLERGEGEKAREDREGLPQKQKQE